MWCGYRPALDESDVVWIQAELDTIMQPYIRNAVHEVLCGQEYLTLCGDLTGRPVSAYSSTYPPDAVFGHMANRLQKGHQAVLVTLKGFRHRVHVTAFHHAGNTVSGGCLREMVAATEDHLGCRPQRRTELLRQRIATLEARITQKQCWSEAQQAVIRQQVERQVRLGNQLQALQPQLVELEAHYEDKPVRSHSKLAQARQQKAGWERQLQSALEHESRARRALRRHRQRLEKLVAERGRLLNWLAKLEIDNATNLNPVRIRWLLDGGFGDAANVTYLIEMGYDVYTIAHNGKTSQVLLKAVDDTFKYSTLISFSDAEALPTADLFPVYHQRQDVEAGIKQGKGTFGFTKLRVRSPAGIRLLGQFALVFWPNFVRWAADWLTDQVRDETARFLRVLQQVQTQVRIAANTPAVVLTNVSGQMLEFAADGPFAGVQIQLDRLFAYQVPMPLFQTWPQQWPVSSESVKEQLSAILARKSSPPQTNLSVAWLNAGLPEKVPKIEVLKRLVL
jgi:hypothetical protein